MSLDETNKAVQNKAKKKGKYALLYIKESLR